MRTIRMVRPADAAAVVEIYAPAILGSAISFEEEVPSAEQMALRISTSLELAPWLVCTQGEHVEGYVYASKHRDRAAYRWSVDVAVYVHPERRRTGVGRALYASLFALLRLQGFRAAHAGITLPNHASVAIHEAMGFRPVAVYPRVGFKNGAWHDVGWWQLELGARIDAPPPPVRLDAARASSEWNEALAAGLSLLAPG